MGQLTCKLFIEFTSCGGLWEKKAQLIFNQRKCFTNSWRLWLYRSYNFEPLNLRQLQVDNSNARSLNHNCLGQRGEGGPCEDPLLSLSVPATPGSSPRYPNTTMLTAKFHSLLPPSDYSPWITHQIDSLQCMKHRRNKTKEERIKLPPPFVFFLAFLISAERGKKRKKKSN